MPRFVVSLILLLATIYVCHAQDLSVKEYSIDSVNVDTARKQTTASVGSSVQSISKVNMETSLTRSMSELLLEASSLQIKSMGQGAMSSVSFRGTSSTHTQVLWNGIAITSPQMGGFDFSQVPVYFADDVTLHYGGSLADGGSGALGGSVAFNNSSSTVDRTQLSLVAETASNDTYTGAMTLRFTYGGLTSSTRVYYQQSDNDYLYLNKVLSKDAFYQRREEADYSQFGLMQELYYKTKRDDELSLIAWWQSDDRSLPQAIMGEVVVHEQAQNSNLRAVASQKIYRSNFNLNNSLAFLYGQLDYQKEMSSTPISQTQNTNNSIIATSALQYDAFDRFDLGANLTYRYDKVWSDNYDDGAKDRNTVLARLYALARISRRFHADAQTTLEILDGSPSAIYSVSAKYFAIDRLLTLKMSNSYNHRNPTLNDLYWSPGGNEDLLPETGFSWDLSFESSPSIGSVDFNLALSLYHMNIENWIMWIPEGNGYVWSPVNYSDVISQGVEFTGQAKFNTAGLSHTLSANYTYAKSVDNTDPSSDSYSRQLPYIPRNRWSVDYYLQLNEKWWFKYDVIFTDVRFTSADESYWTDAYTLHNLEAGYRFDINQKRHGLSVSLKVENLFDSYYESTQYYPMPLRMFWLRGIFTFNK